MGQAAVSACLTCALDQRPVDYPAVPALVGAPALVGRLNESRRQARRHYRHHRLCNNVDNYN